MVRTLSLVVLLLVGCKPRPADPGPPPKLPITVPLLEALCAGTERAADETDAILRTTGLPGTGPFTVGEWAYRGRDDTWEAPYGSTHPGVRALTLRASSPEERPVVAILSLPDVSLEALRRVLDPLLAVPMRDPLGGLETRLLDGAFRDWRVFVYFDPVNGTGLGCARTPKAPRSRRLDRCAERVLTATDRWAAAMLKVDDFPDRRVLMGLCDLVGVPAAELGGVTRDDPLSPLCAATEPEAPESAAATRVEWRVRHAVATRLVVSIDAGLARTADLHVLRIGVDAARKALRGRSSTREPVRSTAGTTHVEVTKDGPYAFSLLDTEGAPEVVIRCERAPGD